MDNAIRRALNSIVEDINYLDDILEAEEYYNPGTTIDLKKELDDLVVSIVQQEAEYKKQAILEDGYVDDVKRIRILLGLANTTEWKA